MKTYITIIIFIFSLNLTAQGLIKRLEYPYATFQNQKAVEVVKVTYKKCWIFQDRYIVTCKLLSCDNGYRYKLMKWEGYKIGDVIILSEEDKENVVIRRNKFENKN